MEPQIIDFYNTEPYMVKVIDNMNKELENLQKEYNKLEEKYNKLYNLYKSPIKILCISIEDRNKKHKELLDNIKIICNDYINRSRNFLYDYGLCDFGLEIYELLYDEFKKLYNNNHVVCNWSGNCINSLTLLRGREMPHWNKIYNSLTINDIKDIMISHIINWIEENIYTCYTWPGDDDY